MQTHNQNLSHANEHHPDDMGLARGITEEYAAKTTSRNAEPPKRVHQAGTVVGEQHDLDDMMG